MDIGEARAYRGSPDPERWGSYADYAAERIVNSHGSLARILVHPELVDVREVPVEWLIKVGDAPYRTATGTLMRKVYGVSGQTRVFYN